MIPILFDENETQFKTYGIGALSDTLSCLVIEERNGIYELEMEYPINGIHFSEISENKIIFAKPSENKNNQAFRIYKITEPISGVVTIYAEHIRYQLNYIPVSPITAQSCIASLNAIKTNSIVTNPFSFHTDKNIEKLYTTGEPKSAGNILGGTEGSILQEFQGEYEFDNWDVYLWTHRGSDTGVTLRYGKNITDFERERDLTNTVTGVLPYWKNEEHLVMGDISEVSSGNAPKKIETIDVTSEFTSETEGYAPTKAEVTQAGYKALQNKSYIGVPSINFKISFVALWQTEEYKDIAPLESVGLCDTVTVVFEPLVIQTKAKVIRTEYDVLLERYNEIEIGDLKGSLSSTIITQQQQIAENQQQLVAQEQDIKKAYSRIDQTDSSITAEVINRQSADNELSSRIALTDSSITAEVANRIAGDNSLSSKIDMQINSITLKVTNSNTTSLLVLTAGETVLASQTIELIGLVKFTDLSSAGQTSINGANITTGTISAININGSTITGSTITATSKLYVSYTSDGRSYTTEVGLAISDLFANTTSLFSNVGTLNSDVSSLKNSVTYVQSAADAAQSTADSAVNQISALRLQKLDAINPSVTGTFTSTNGVNYLGSIISTYTRDSTTSTAANGFVNASTGHFGRSTASSKRYKHDIKPLEKKELNPQKLYDLEVSEYVYNTDYLKDESDKRYNKQVIGFIAENVNEVYPVAADINADGEVEDWNFRYMIPAMLKLIQEQHADIENLKAEVEELKNVK